jgi:hypothetical protein
VAKGKRVLILRGHETYTLAAVWKDHLIRLLADTDRGRAGEGG